ncbi:hypothetical protein Tco_1190600 [Tanacetum coccineum]
MDSEKEKKIEGTKIIEEAQEETSAKKQRIEEGSGSTTELKEPTQEEIQNLMIVAQDEGLLVEPLQTKYPIIDWEVYTEESRKHWRIIRVGGQTEAYQFFDDMLKNFNREDLVKLWSLVKERFNSKEPTYDKERELWVELKRLFKPDLEDELWKSQGNIHQSNMYLWRLYDSSGVHHVAITNGIDIYMLVERDYPLSHGVLLLMLVIKLLIDQPSEMANELMRRIYTQANRR